MEKKRKVRLAAKRAGGAEVRRYADALEDAATDIAELGRDQADTLTLGSSEEAVAALVRQMRRIEERLGLGGGGNVRSTGGATA